MYELYALNASLKAAPGHAVMHVPSQAHRRTPIDGRENRSLTHGEGLSSLHHLHDTPSRECETEPVRQWIEPWADVPGHTCIDRFLSRMRRQHACKNVHESMCIEAFEQSLPALSHRDSRSARRGALAESETACNCSPASPCLATFALPPSPCPLADVPMGNDHNAFRRWASKWRGRCHTDPEEMEMYFASRHVAKTSEAARGKLAGYTGPGKTEQSAGPREGRRAVVPEGLGMPQRHHSPRVREVRPLTSLS